jgi:hypothetical protein
MGGINCTSRCAYVVSIAVVSYLWHTCNRIFVFGIKADWKLIYCG